MFEAVSPLAGALAVSIAWLAIAALALIPARNALFARQLAFPLGALAGLALAGFGLEGVWLLPAQMTLPLGMPDLPFHLRLDPLAGFFLMLLGSVAAGISVYAGGIFGERYASRGRVSNVIPVDVAVPGCPPPQAAIIQGILTAVSAAGKAGA